MRLNATAMMVFSLFLFSIKYQIAFDAFLITSKKLNTPHGRFLKRSAAERFFVSETCFCKAATLQHFFGIFVYFS